MSYTCSRIEGGLISPDFLESIHEQAGQKPSDFGLDAKRTIIDEVSSVWADVRAYWLAFQRRLARAKDESETTITREQWVIPLLETLGYELVFQRKAPEVDGRTYAFSHTAGANDGAPPMHVVAFDQDLGSRPPAGRGTMSPHALVQDYLNRTEELWGAVTNGRVFRLLRDSSYFTRPAYIEFDLEQMLEGERLDEFILFYRIAHRTRLPEGIEDAPKCLLERYHQDAIEQGGRIRDGLRDAVEAAILKLGNGFLAHPRNEVLREKARTGSLSPGSFYKQLLYLIYRMFFLMVAEERGLLATDSRGGKPKTDPAIEPYTEYFSFARLRKLADTPLSAPGRFDDLYLGLRSLFFVLRDDKMAGKLGLPPLNGELFNPMEDLEEAHLSNQALLEAVDSFSYFTPKDEKVRRRVNYGALDVEELGSVYESLLDYQPVFTNQTGIPGFEFVAGTERKTTGSYYTRPELVNELVSSALVPVMEERLQKAGKDPEEKEKALLSIRVCDPACGSGHFLLAAARRIARELAKIRTETEEPSPDAVRTAVRDVITHCVYGVDKNPLAVDLCKVALWIEGHGANRPLTFLDHRIRCGDSLVGVLDMEALEDGIPDAAYDPVTGDDKSVAKELKQRNKKEREGARSLPFGAEQEEAELSGLLQPVLELSDDTPEEVRKKRIAFEQIHSKGTKLWHDEAACNLWTGTFFSNLTGESRDARHAPTTDDLWSFMENEGSVDARLPAHAWQLQSEHRLFHWPLEFPDVFENGGFDVVLCNPPWERIKLQEQEFFSTKDTEIARAPNKAARQKLIKKLPESNPALWREYHAALHYADALSKYLRASGRFPLTARGDINTYSVFAELFSRVLKSSGRAGILLPTGIATDDTNKQFFGHLVESELLASLFDFENRERIFPAIDSRMKFSLLTIRREADTGATPPEFAFFLTRASHIQDDRRRFTLSSEDFAMLNPNTRTCPIFRTKADAELTKKIYERVPVLVNEKTGENPWGIRFLAMFHMANDSHLFRTREQLESEGYRLHGNRFTKGDDTWLPLYEGKMVQAFDHRAADVVVNPKNIKRPGQPRELSCRQHADSKLMVAPQYFVSKSSVADVTSGVRSSGYIAFKSVTSPTNERTMIASVLPFCGVANSMIVVFHDTGNELSSLVLLANLDSVVFDYIAKQKVGGVNLNFFFVKQFPILEPSRYSASDNLFLLPRLFELFYTSWDIKLFADDGWSVADDELRGAISKQWDENQNTTGGHEWSPPEWAEIVDDGLPLPPFKWDEDRRARLRAELDAYYARLYGLTEDELRYILDPSDIYGPDFPGETFRVLKEKEIKQYGEYRTKRLVLAAWERHIR